MSVLFIGKRFYTNRDGLRERYGRIYQLPWHWSQAGIPTKLWLVDYHTRETVRERDGTFDTISTPVRNFALFRRWLSGAYRRGIRFDTVVASGDCYVGLMGYRIAKRLRARFVFDVYDKYDEFGAYRRIPGFDPFVYLLGRADACLFASKPLLERLAQSGVKNLLVPNGIDTRIFHPLPMGPAREKFGLSDDVKFIGYFGSMDIDRGIDDLLVAHRMLQQDVADVQLLVGGKQRCGLDLCQPGVRYLGDLPHVQVPQALACCTMLALPYRRSTYLDMASSCKIAEYLAMERPLVATRTPNLVENFPAQAAQLDTVLAEPGDPSALANSIRLQLEKRLLADMSVNCSWAEIARCVAGDLGLSGKTRPGSRR